jgi:hypothetical protein
LIGRRRIKELVLDGRNAPTQVIDVVHPANSVNPKTFSHGNTELNLQRCDKCVQTGYGASLKEEGTVGTLQKCNELSRNVITSQQCEVTKSIISTIVGIIGFALMVKKFAPIQVTGMVKSPNSVNPKTFSHGNTEPSMNFNRFKACVENSQRLSILDKDKFRTLRKRSEPFRNEMVAC